MITEIRQLVVEGWSETDSKIVIGLVYHLETEMWQTWTSLDGDDVTCLSAHKDFDAAKDTLDLFADGYSQGKFGSGDRVARFLGSLQMDALPSPLPQRIVNQIGEAMKHFFII